MSKTFPTNIEILLLQNLCYNHILNERGQKPFLMNRYKHIVILPTGNRLKKIKKLAFIILLCYYKIELEFRVIATQ